MSFLNSLWLLLKNLFSRAEVEAIDFLTDLALKLAHNGGDILIKAAQAAVESAEQSGASGSDKFQQAYEAVKGTLADAGVEAVESAIRGAIEGAVARLHNQ